MNIWITLQENRIIQCVRERKRIENASQIGLENGAFLEAQQKFLGDRLGWGWWSNSSLSPLLPAPRLQPGCTPFLMAGWQLDILDLHPHISTDEREVSSCTVSALATRWQTKPCLLPEQSCVNLTQTKRSESREKVTSQRKVKVFLSEKQNKKIHILPKCLLLLAAHLRSHFPHSARF